jgi:hypothetical protein
MSYTVKNKEVINFQGRIYGAGSTIPGYPDPGPVDEYKPKGKKTNYVVDTLSDEESEK